MTKEDATGAPKKPIKQKFYGILVAVFFTFYTCAALTIPFGYESMTLWYKVGIDKTLLLGGQLAGVLATVLLFIQILLGARSRFLQEIFGIAKLMQWHRGNGLILSLVALGHALLVLLPEGLANLPVGQKHWPEMVGGLLLLLLLFMALSSHFRQRLALNYQRWRRVHKVCGYFVLSFIALHVLVVSDSFHHMIPKTAFLGSLLGVIGAVILTKIAKRRPERKDRR